MQKDPAPNMEKTQLSDKVEVDPLSQKAREKNPGWFVDQTSSVRYCLLDVADNLDGLSNAFHTTGNRVVADRLFTQSVELREAAKRLREVVGIHSLELHDASMKSTTQRLSAVLGGVLRPGDK